MDAHEELSQRSLMSPDISVTLRYIPFSDSFYSKVELCPPYGTTRQMTGWGNAIYSMSTAGADAMLADLTDYLAGVIDSVRDQYNAAS